MSAEVRPIKTAAEQALAEAFAARKGALARDPLAAQREAAFRRFAAEGLPHRRVEDWKYTDLRALMREAKPLAGPPDTAGIARAKNAGGLLRVVDARRIVLVDGVFVPELSDLAALEPGLTVGSMAEALAGADAEVVGRVGTVAPTDDVAAALNTAFMGDGVVLNVADGVTLARPIHLVFAYTATVAAAVFARSLVVIGKRARATLIESHEGPDDLDYQVNNALELSVGDDAKVDHVKIGTEGSRALHISTLMAALGARAELNDLSFTTGGSVVRNQLHLRYAGEGAAATIAGASLIKGRQHVDTTMVVDHAVRGGSSRELFKSVLDGESHAVFQGKIIVRPGAQQTDARMMTRALLLSEAAEADNKPELEIFADDVQCGHGATAGALDQDLLFYLKARGIPAHEAEALLIQAFVGEALETIERDDLRAALADAAAAWLITRG
ncbi:MAG: Fe-S cluster assembly protein SufD [Hyphomicrobiales bacterium]|nr:Fe-S cluster assembly protein SufD [Hyphomicrobiales bacterium]MBV8824865.1 Fe-S cluster assembly protein SufD [Hyphomicrobiales bacterium]MBV9429545.1 Fe-S cluster assembly protein SufD [Bradyrhizobiaceae bacterium]